MPQGNTIGDMLDMSVDEATEGVSFDFDFDEDEYDEWSRFDRSMAFDILWDELSGDDHDLVDDDGYPRDLVEHDEIVGALCSNRDRRYRVEYPDGQERVLSATGVVLYAWMDPDAEVSFADV